METKSKQNLFKSIIINIFILIVMLLITDMAYETNDDYAIASRLAADYPYVGFVNYYLCKAIIVMNKICPAANWYVIIMIAASLTAFSCILFTIFNAGTDRIIRVAASVMIALYSFDHYSTVQFTKTAALVMTAGMLMLVDCLTEKRKAPGYVVSLLLIYLGACIRVDALLGATGFIGIYGLIWLIQNRKRLIKEEYFTVKKITLYVIIVGLVFGAYELDQLSCRINTSTDELQYAEDYSVYRSNIVDYPTYEYYKDNIDSYDAIGISENDIYLIDHWVFDYDGAASMDNLRNIDKIKRNEDGATVILTKSIKKCLRETYKGIRAFSFTGIHVIYLLAISLWVIMALKPKHWPYVIGVGLMSAALYFAVYYMQRPAYRALYVADVGAAVWLLYYLMKNSGKKTDGARNGASAVMGVTVILITLMLIVPAFSGAQSKASNAESKVMSKTMQEYFMQHEDSLFVWATTEKKQARAYSTPWKLPDGRDHNVTGTGGWGVLSPYMLDRLSEFGVYNPIKDLIDNENAYYIGNKNIKRLEEYYNKWYGSTDTTIYMNEVDEVEGQKIWKVISEEKNGTKRML